MKNEILDATELTDEVEPFTPDDLIANLLQDLILDNPPSDIATDFIDCFVLQERDESPAILAMLDAPTESIIELLKQVVTANYNGQIEALDAKKGFEFIEGLKKSVKTQLEELAK
jgi:hypothetical protein